MNKLRKLARALWRRLPESTRQVIFARLGRFAPIRLSAHAPASAHQLRALSAQARRIFRFGRQPRVLFATHLGAFNHGIVVDSILGLSLKERGARADLLLCDQFLPGCQSMKLGGTPLESFAQGARHPRCPSCFQKGSDTFRATGLPVLRLSEYVPENVRKAIHEKVAELPFESLSTFEKNGLALGEHAHAGALRFYARGDLRDQEKAEPVLRRYLEAAWLAAEGMERMLEKNRYDVVVAHHGIYVPQGQAVAVCKKRGVRVVTWNPAYRKHSFIFSHDDSYHHTMVDEPTGSWRNMPWTAELEAELDRYLKSRWYGTEDWIWFHNEPQFEIQTIAEDVGFSLDKPLVTLLSNVVWDAQLHYGSNAFPGMVEWVFETIRYFAGRPGLQLAIRIHPAEVRGFVPSRQPLETEIRAKFPVLPPNVFLISPESEASTYALCDASNAVLIYNTKTGMEVTARGIPTVVAGEAWIRNKGFTKDATDPASYFRILDQLPFKGRMSPSETEQARRYAYHVFFKRMIPVPFLRTQKDSTMEITLDRLERLRPGNFPGLDTICDGILHGTPFIHEPGRPKPSAEALPLTQLVPA